LVETVKIAIECDGFEFHSSKESLIRDTIRTRKLTLNKWIVYRFTGTEIHNMNDDKIFKFFEEIRDLVGVIIM
jgi:very-short-patch-repair endonuclease